MGLISQITSLFRRDVSVPQVPDGTRVGTSGTTYVGTFLSSAETNAKLSSPQNRFKTYDQMSLNVAIVATAIRYVSALISSTEWYIHPPRKKASEKEKTESDVDDPVGALTEAEYKKAREYADAIAHNIRLMETPWFKVVRAASQFKWKGFSVQEMIAARMEEIAPGYIGIKFVENRPQHTIEEWEIDDDSGEVEAFGQRDPNDAGQVNWIPRDKCLYIVDDTLTAQPDGVGLLRHVVELCDQLKRLEQLEGWAFETDLRGVPIGYAPLGILDDMVQKGRISADDRTAQLAGIKSFIENHMRNPNLGLLLDSTPYSGRDATATPSRMKMFELMLAKGSGVGLAEIHQSIERKNHEIARALGVEQFMLGSGGKGSLALSEDKARSLVELINAIIMEITWSIEHDYIRKIFELNRWDLKLMPNVRPDAVALRSVSVIVEVLSKLALAGATIDRNDPVINQIRRMIKLVDQPFVTEEMKGTTKTPNSGGTPGVKLPNKPTPTKD